MNQNVLLRRVFIVVIAAIVCVTVFTGLAYSFMFNIRFAYNQAEQLMPKARALGRIVSRADEDEQTQNFLQWIMAQKDDFFLFSGTHVLIYDQQGRLIKSNLDSSVSAEFIQPLLDRTLSGREATGTGKVISGGPSMLVVGAPILTDSDESLGSLFLCVEMEKAMSASKNLIGIWPFSLLMATPLVLLLMFLLVDQIIKPIRRIRDTANRMASGDLALRADETARGEVGQMAHALNYLCAQLTAKLDELTVERDRLRQSVDGMAEGFMSVDSLGNIVHNNPALSAMFPEGRQYSDPRMTLVPDEQVWQCVDNVLRSGSAQSIQMQRGDQAFHVTVTPITQGGAVALFADITQEARLERTRREYVANVSHELRTPLTAVRALVEPLRDGMVANEATRERYYDTILSEITRLSRLIDNLMELSRLQSEQSAPELSPIPLEQMLSDMAFKYQAIARDRDQTVELFVPENCPPVMADEDRLEELLVILLDNAMKYTPDGGMIRLGARHCGEKMEVFVRDTGVGIQQSDLPYVFDRFYKVDKAHTGRGSGLGLSIAREILTRMGEDIHVISTPGSGSEFYFTLRCFHADPSAVPDPPAS